MKKIICLLLVLSMVLPMTGCDEEELMDAIGEEIKDQVHQAGEDLKQEAEDAVNDAVESGKDAVQDAVDGALDDVKDAGQDALDSVVPPSPETKPTLSHTEPSQASQPESEESLPSEQTSPQSENTETPAPHSTEAPAPKPQKPAQKPKPKPDEGVPPVTVPPEEEDNLLDWVEDTWHELTKSTEQKCREAGHPPYKVDEDTGSVTCKCERLDYNDAESPMEYEKFKELVTVHFWEKEDEVAAPLYLRYIGTCYNLTPNATDILCSYCMTDAVENMEAKAFRDGISNCSQIMGVLSNTSESSWQPYAKDFGKLSRLKKPLKDAKSAADEVKRAIGILDNISGFNSSLNSSGIGSSKQETFRHLVGALQGATSYLPYGDQYFGYMLDTLGTGLDVVAQGVDKQNFCRLAFNAHEYEMNKGDMTDAELKNVTQAEKILAFAFKQKPLKLKHLEALSGSNTWSQGPTLAEISQAHLSDAQLLVMAPYINFRYKYEVIDHMK